MNIDITTTATLRPSIVERTLWSFWRLCFKEHNARLILNVDPVGDERYTQKDIVAIARKYFPKMVVRTPSTASYLSAVKWAWENVETDVFFFLEDDYYLFCPIDLDAMYKAFLKDERLAVLRLPKGNTTENECYWARANHGFVAIWNGLYYAGPHLQFSGMPSMIRTTWMRPFLDRLTFERSLEIQFRRLNDGRASRDSIMYGWKYGAFAEPNTPITVQDIGTGWRRRLRIGKNGGPREEKIGFTGWIRCGKPYNQRLRTSS